MCESFLVIQKLVSLGPMCIICSLICSCVSHTEPSFPHLTTASGTVIDTSPYQQQPDLLLGLIAVLVLNQILDLLTEIKTVGAGRGIAMASG